MKTCWILILATACAAPDEYPCGNGRIDADEECDDGNTEDFDDACGFCRVRTAICGDGSLQSWEETCDPTALGGETCRADCTMPSCGDGVARAGDVCYQAGEDLLAIELHDAAIELVDLDGDGALDIVMTHGGPTGAAIEVAFNDAAGSFTRMTVTVPSGVSVARLAIGDLDGDLDIDVAVGSGDQLYIATNQGTRQLVLSSPTTITAGWVSDIVLGDFTGDGVVDVAVGHATALTVLPRGGLLPFGTIQLRADIKASELGVGDFNADGTLDIVAVDGELSFVIAAGGTQLSTTSGGTVAEQTSDLQVVDLNADGRLDLVVTATTQGTSAPRVLIARADRSTFDERDVELAGRVLVADADADGTLDLIGLDYEGETFDGMAGAWRTVTARGLGDGSFATRPYVYVHLGLDLGSGLFGDTDTFDSLRAGDIDGDGDLDLLALSGRRGWLFGEFVARAIRIQRGTL